MRVVEAIKGLNVECCDVEKY